MVILVLECFDRVSYSLDGGKLWMEGKLCVPNAVAPRVLNWWHKSESPLAHGRRLWSMIKHRLFGSRLYTHCMKVAAGCAQCAVSMPPRAKKHGHLKPLFRSAPLTESPVISFILVSLTAKSAIGPTKRSMEYSLLSAVIPATFRLFLIRDALERGEPPPPPPPSRAPGLRTATASLTPSASFNGICNRQQPPPTASSTSSNRLSNCFWGHLRGPFPSIAALPLILGTSGTIQSSAMSRDRDLACFTRGVLNGKKKKMFRFPTKTRGHSMCSTMVGGSWRLAVGGSWRLAVGNWRLVAVGGG